MHEDNKIRVFKGEQKKTLNEFLKKQSLATTLENLEFMKNNLNFEKIQVKKDVQCLTVNNYLLNETGKGK